MTFLLSIQKLKQWSSMLLLSLAVTLVVGCANPLGLSKAEWESMTPAQQQEARAEQQARDEAARKLRAEQRAQQQAAEAAEEARLVDLRRNAAFGDVVQCTITAAKGRFSGNEWHPAQQVSVEIHRSESERVVELSRKDRPSTTTELHISFDGLNVKVCRSYDRDCDVLAGSELQFRRGISKQINVDRTVEGTLTCSFPRRR